MHSLLMLAHPSSFIVLLDLYDTRINEAESPQVVICSHIKISKRHLMLAVEFFITMAKTFVTGNGTSS